MFVQIIEERCEGLVLGHLAIDFSFAALTHWPLRG